MKNCCILFIIILCNSDKYTNKFKQYKIAFDKKMSNKTNDKILSYHLIYESKESFDLEEMKKQIKMLEKGLNRLDVYIYNYYIA